MLRIIILSFVLINICASATASQLKFEIDNALNLDQQSGSAQIYPGQIFKITRGCKASSLVLWEIQTLSPELSLDDMAIDILEKNNVCQVLDNQIFYFKAEKAGLAKIVLQLKQNGKVLDQQVFTIDIVNF